MIFLIVLLAFIAFVALWVLWLRNWMKEKPWAAGFFAAIEPAEIYLWNKSETILWSRFLMFLGVLPPILDQIAMLNTPAIIAIVPERWTPYLSLSFVVAGTISEALRRATTKPLEVVALPDVLPPAVAQAVAVADVASKEAVAAVKADAVAVKAEASAVAAEKAVVVEAAKIEKTKDGD